MTLTPRPNQGHCRYLFALTHSHFQHVLASRERDCLRWREREREQERERQREGNAGHYLDETELDTVSQANVNIALLSFNGDYTLKVHPELILFNTAYSYMFVCGGGRGGVHVCVLSFELSFM